MTRRKKRTIVIGSVVLVALAAAFFTLWIRVGPDRPLSYLRLTDNQARQVEDWVEAHPYPSYYPYKRFDKTQQATNESQDVFLRAVLTPEQWAEYIAANSPGGRCINPGCPVHGRVVNPAMMVGFIRRHLPPDWSVRPRFSLTNSTVWITGQATTETPKEFKICMVPPPNPCSWPVPIPPDLAKQGFRWVKPPADGGSIQPLLIYVKYEVPPEEGENLEALIRRATLCDMEIVP